ncbi:MAG: Na+/H+ antiporter subunit E [Euryarchaeota archaeon]|nr:MAG: multicomponent Na+:H+ antiporter subunit E [ANME-2 cluster archaeon]MEA1865480.1 Na+/H+ antiporter subunit E [Euryarchaeota archaeon]
MNIKHFIATYIIVLTFWLLLSAHFDKFHVGAGIMCSGLVAYASHDLLFKDTEKHRLTKTLRFITYIPWLIYQIVLANIDVAKRALSPSMPIDPQVVTFKTILKSDVARTALANSITLTPGTVTIDIVDNVFYVHAIAKEPADDLLEGAMERRIAHVFMED